MFMALAMLLVFCGLFLAMRDDRNPYLKYHYDQDGRKR
jgi:hypothetical protein